MKSALMTEDEFLSARVADERTVYCWLASGIKLEGTIRSFDAEAIFMRPRTADGDADEMMIYKIQIASIAPVPMRDGLSPKRR